jgi:GNAT superfamily N-acetyltransferase
MSEALTLRLMNRDEVDDLVVWAADEGWNPGLHDADLFWAADPEAFIAAELDGVVIGGGAIASYDGDFGFMGLSVVRPQFRGAGLGGRLWHARLGLLRSRLAPGAPIGLDGVLQMQEWYGRAGFAYSHRSIRYEGSGRAADWRRGIVPASEVPFEQLLAYDRRCFPGDRGRFLRAWMAQPDSLALAAMDGATLRGYGVVRRCGRGARIGPLFADDATVAADLFVSLASYLPGEPVFIDVPQINAWAMSLAQRHEMREVFSRARMYIGPHPRLADARIYGITTFELG